MRTTPARLIPALLSAALVAACHDTTAPGEHALKWATIAASDLSLFTCALTTDGAAYCWGDNFYGQLGNGSADSATADPHPTPVPVAGGLRFTTITVGMKHACALTSGGTAYCWGANDVGQLGDGSDDAATGHRRLTPTPVTGGLTFTDLSAGGLHTCGVTTGAIAYCWGNDAYGEVGDGGLTGDVFYRVAPTPVSGGLSFRGVATGELHSCGLTLTGRAYCWGINLYGQLGDSTQVVRTRPVAVAGGLTFDRLAAGFRQTCALRNNLAYCWGEAFPNGLGIGSAQQYCYAQGIFDGSQACSTFPAPVTGGLAFVALAAGRASNCGLTANGTAYCWGTAPSVVPGGLAFQAIATGGVHTCGVTIDGAAYCWGDNYNGELGDGTRTNSDQPVRVATP